MAPRAASGLLIFEPVDEPAVPPSSFPELFPQAVPQGGKWAADFWARGRTSCPPELSHRAASPSCRPVDGPAVPPSCPLELFPRAVSQGGKIILVTMIPYQAGTEANPGL